MFASAQNIENAFIYADKALEFAFGRRLQSIGRHQKVPPKNLLVHPYPKLMSSLGTERMTTTLCLSIMTTTR